MADDIKLEENIANMTQEEKAKAWETWVKDGINGLLNIFLIPAKDCNYNVKYFPHVVQEFEGSVEYDESKADGVLLSVMFTFKEPIEPLKPID